MSDEKVRFGVLCAMFQAMIRDRSSGKKRKRFRTFLDRVYTGLDFFSAIRLILPSLDRERGSYGLKEWALAQCLVDSLGLSKDSDDALRLIKWRKGGARTGANAGNFALVAAEVLHRRQGMASGGLTIKEVNVALDQLASKENRGEKAYVLSGLIKKTNALEMKWILMIILKDLKLGISEKSIFHEFHPDAEDLFNVTCDLKLVCEKLKDRNQRHKRQDIEVGKAVRPQLAMRVSDAVTAWKKLHGKEVVVECKFDGDRIQIHKNGSDINFFSRNFLDHSEYAHGMSNVIMQNILVDRCILDGEMLVWDTSTNRFAEFGSNQEIAKVARDGLQSDRQVKWFKDRTGSFGRSAAMAAMDNTPPDVAFDVLYVEDTSIIHQSITERHDLLRKVIKPVKGRLEILVPDDGLNDHLPPGEPCWSILAYKVEDVERFFKETIQNRDEGIVLKDLASKWEPGDRSGKWLKLKPDYVHAGSDLDVLIIGGYFGSGRRGGEVAQFLVGLAERSDPTTYPKRFLSFCRVGTGLSDDELDAVIAKLKPYFRKNEYPKNTPRFYEVTNNSKERPDVWIDSPDKSIILSITSDIRTVKSEVFATPYGLRFPRIHRVRYDKPWHECLDVQSFVDLVHSSNGNIQRGMDHGGLQNHNSKRTRLSKKGDRKNVSIVPAHFVQTDVSGIKGETLIFTNMMFYFVNFPSSYSLDYFHKMVAENGGTFSMNLNDSVTHCIAAEKKGIKYQAAMRRGDIIHYSWVLDCCREKRLLHLQPKYFLFLTDSSKTKLHEEIDTFSDYYYWDIDLTDIKQMFSNMDGSADSKTINYYRKKYCPMAKWCAFQDCTIYFYSSPILNPDCKVISDLSLRRMELEVTMRGGEVSKSLLCATHLVAYSTSDAAKDFDIIYRSCPPTQKNLLHEKRLHVVRHQWLEDSLKSQNKLSEDTYSLKPDTFEGLHVQSGQVEEVPMTTDTIDKQRAAPSPDKGGQRKRRPSNVSIKRGRQVTRPSRRTRARIGSRPARIDPDELDNSPSSNDDTKRDALEKGSLVSAQEIETVREPETLGDSGHLHQWESTEREDMLDDKGLEVHHTEPDEKKSNPDGRNIEGSDDLEVIEEPKKGTGAKLEVMLDPMQAMLLDMIPSLGQKKVETGEKKVETGETSLVEERPELHTDQVKKKKVSYKDVASQLLKDW